MNALAQFTIPFGGMKPGKHELCYILDAVFFANFEQSYISEANIEVKVEADKQENLIDLAFHVGGTIPAVCDRTLKPYEQVIENQFFLKIKYATEAYEDDEVIYVSREQSELNIAHHLYEFAVLSLPKQFIHPDHRKDKTTKIWQFGNENQETEKIENIFTKIKI